MVKLRKKQMKVLEMNPAVGFSQDAKELPG
jgi:hypothetical protein